MIFSRISTSQPSFFISTRSQRCRLVRSDGEISPNWIPYCPLLLAQVTRPGSSTGASLLLPGIVKTSAMGAPDFSEFSVRTPAPPALMLSSTASNCSPAYFIAIGSSSCAR